MKKLAILISIILLAVLLMAQQQTNVANFSYSHITTNASTQVKTGAGFLHGLVINQKGATANLATIFDNTACSGTVIGIVDTTAGVGMVLYDVQFNIGLCVQTATGTPGDLTVSSK